MIEPREWIFTFGHGHDPDHHYYVRIPGTFEEARLVMFRKFGRKWAGQYASEEEAGVAQFNLKEYRMPLDINTPPPLPQRAYDTEAFLRVCLTNPIVRAALERGASLEDIIIALHNRCDELETSARVLRGALNVHSELAEHA